MSNECREWSKYRLPRGYGQTRLGNRVVLAHRLAYCQAHGLSLEEIDGQVVRHTCDNPPCVNPDHLVLGSHKDNMEDMVSRGRSAKGERSGKTNLSQETINYCRSVYIPRHRELGGRALARRFGVSQAAMARALRGETYE